MKIRLQSFCEIFFDFKQRTGIIQKNSSLTDSSTKPFLSFLQPTEITWYDLPVELGLKTGIVSVTPGKNTWDTNQSVPSYEWDIMPTSKKKRWGK